MNYYRIKNNEIVDFADWKYSEDCLETNESIVRNYDGKLVFEKDANVDKINSQLQIAKLKQKLQETDYKAIKYAEGVLTKEEYEPIKKERQALRDKINQLEQK